jgi:glycine betaine/proline transport system substrate-binding protein
VAYAFLKTIRMNAEELVSLENAIAKAGDPVKGSQAWLEDNRDVVQPAIDAAKQAQGS